jgi:hypothetical protein
MATPTIVSGSLSETMSAIITNIGGTATSKGLDELWVAFGNALISNFTGGATQSALMPTGTLASTIGDRSLWNESQSIAVASGTMQLDAIKIANNTKITNLNVLVGSTASSGVSHNWMLLADLNRKVLAASADNTATDLTASAVSTYALTTPYTTTYAGLYYVGFMMVAGTTQPTLAGYTQVAATANGLVPKFAGASNTGATTPLAVGATCTAITASASNFTAYLT